MLLLDIIFSYNCNFIFINMIIINNILIISNSS